MRSSDIGRRFSVDSDRKSVIDPDAIPDILTRSTSSFVRFNSFKPRNRAEVKSTGWHSLLEVFSPNNSHRLNTYHDDLQIFPALRFKNEKMEFEYAKSLHQMYNLYCKYSGVIGLWIIALCGVTYWVLRWKVYPELLNRYATVIMAFLVILFFLFGIITFIPQIKLLNRNPEVALFWILSAVLLNTSACLSFSGYFSYESPQLLRRLEIKLLIDFFFNTLITWFIVCIDGVFKARTNLTIYVHLFCMVALTVPNMIIQRVDVEEMTLVPPALGKNFLKIMSLSQLGIYFYLLFLGYVNAVQKELVDRIEFLGAKKETTLLEGISSQRVFSEKSENTAADRFVRLLERAKQKIREVALDTGDIWLEEADSSLKDCLSVLTKTDDLFATRFFSKLSGIPETVKEHYYNMYASDAILRNTSEPSKKVLKPIVRSSAEPSPDNTKAIKSQISELTYLNMVNPHNLEYLRDKAGFCINTNFIDLSRRYPTTYIDTGYTLIKPYMESLLVSEGDLINFLHAVSGFFFTDNPFSNTAHCATTANSLVIILKHLHFDQCVCLEGWEILVMILVTLCHAVGHPGRLDNFLEKTSDILSLVYNENRTVPKYSGFLLFSAVLSKDNTNIFRHVPFETFRQVKKKIIELLLSMDTTTHYEIVSRFKLKSMNKEFDHLRNTEDMWLTAKVALQLADHSFCLMDWENHYEWICCLTDELHLQAHEEIRAGVSMTYICNPEISNTVIPLAMTIFMKIIVLPLIEEIRKCKTHTEDPWGIYEDAVHYNIKHWEVASRNRWKLSSSDLNSKSTGNETKQKTTEHFWRTLKWLIHNREIRR